RPQIDAWHRAQAQGSEQARQWSAAVRHLDFLIDAAPKDWPLRLRRALAHLRVENWERAADDASQAVTLGADDQRAWYWQAVAQLRRGDGAGYSRTCASVRERFRKSEDPATLRAVLRTCLLGPGGAEGAGDWLVELARNAGREKADPSVTTWQPL